MSVFFFEGRRPVTGTRDEKHTIQLTIAISCITMCLSLQCVDRLFGSCDFVIALYNLPHIFLIGRHTYARARVARVVSEPFGGLV